MLNLTVRAHDSAWRMAQHVITSSLLDDRLQVERLSACSYLQESAAASHEVRRRGDVGTLADAVPNRFGGRLWLWHRL